MAGSSAERNKPQQLTTRTRFTNTTLRRSIISLSFWVVSSKLERLWMSREGIGDFLSLANHCYVTFMSLSGRQRQRMYQKPRAGRESCNANAFSVVIPSLKLVVIACMRNERLIVSCQ